MERRNLTIAIIFTIVGIFLLASIPFNTSTRAPKAGYMINVNPRTFPTIMTIIMIGTGLFNVVISAKAYKKSLSASSGRKKEKASTFDLKNVFPLFIILLANIILLPYLGYIITTLISCVLVALYFKAHFWPAVLLGILLSPLIYFLFVKIGVPLPRGILYFF